MDGKKKHNQSTERHAFYVKNGEKDFFSSLSFLLSILLLSAHAAYLSSNLHENCFGPFHLLGLNHWVIRIIKMTPFRFFFTHVHAFGLKPNKKIQKRTHTTCTTMMYRTKIAC